MQKLRDMAASIAKHLEAIEGLLDDVVSELQCIELDWQAYDQAAELRVRRQDIGRLVTRFRGSAEALVVDRLRYLVVDFNRSFAPHIRADLSLARIGEHEIAAVDEALASFDEENRRVAT